MKPIAFDKAEREAITGRIQRYFVDELETTIGTIPAQQLLQFFGEIIGPYYYNKGLADAQAAFARQADSFNDEIYGLEQRDARTR
jgi:uncharacterized protein (DUF2164 family)